MFVCYSVLFWTKSCKNIMCPLSLTVQRGTNTQHCETKCDARKVSLKKPPVYKQKCPSHWILDELKSNNTHIPYFFDLLGFKPSVHQHLWVQPTWTLAQRHNKVRSPTRWQQKDLTVMCCCSLRVNSHWITWGRKLLQQCYIWVATSTPFASLTPPPSLMSPQAVSTIDRKHLQWHHWFSWAEEQARWMRWWSSVDLLFILQCLLKQRRTGSKYRPIVQLFHSIWQTKNRSRWRRKKK